jgi:hypothetical protein
MVRAVDATGQWEVTQMVQSFENLPSFIKEAEEALEEQCSEVVFHNGLWTKTRDEILSKEKEAHQ